MPDDIQILRELRDTIDRSIQQLSGAAPAPAPVPATAKPAPSYTIIEVAQRLNREPPVIMFWLISKSWVRYSKPSRRWIIVAGADTMLTSSTNANLFAECPHHRVPSDLEFTPRGYSIFLQEFQ